MTLYIARRLLWTAIVVTVVLLLTFVVFYKLPQGDPAVRFAGKAPTPELLHEIRVRLGLNALFIFWRQLHLTGGTGYVPLTQSFTGFFSHMVLPWAVLALLYAAFYARVTRNTLLETLGEDYIRTARAKGLSERRVIFKHGLRASLTPIVTMFGLDIALLVGGAIITESVFNLQGLGYLAINNALQQDLPVVLGVVLLASVAVALANLIVDVLYAFIDPRVRYA